MACVLELEKLTRLFPLVNKPIACINLGAGYTVLLVCYFCQTLSMKSLECARRYIYRDDWRKRKSRRSKMRTLA